MPGLAPNTRTTKCNHGHKLLFPDLTCVFLSPFAILNPPPPVTTLLSTHEPSQSTPLLATSDVGARRHGVGRDGRERG